MSGPVEMVDAAARKLISTALDASMVVEAAAGTGKTTELTRRIVAVLASGAAGVDGIVAVTFTEKAAGELKLRLRAALEEARHAADAGSLERGNLERALARLEEARVNTIHGFCADLLRERPVEAGIDPQFVPLTEPEAERLYAEAFSLWFQHQLESPSEGVRRSLRRPSRDDEEDGATNRLRNAGWALAGWRDFPAPWSRQPFDRTAEIDALVDQLHGFAALTARCAKANDNLLADTEPARRLSDEVLTFEAVRPRDHDGLEAALIKLPSEGRFRRGRLRKGYGTRYGEGVTREEVLAAHERLLASIDGFAARADADLAALLQVELSETVKRYEELKERSGHLDFLDLLLRARDLVRDNPEVRADFQARFTRIFVDEFQDTDPLQAEILMLLASSDPAVRDWRDAVPAPGKLFLVGDPKQSIYRFRRADVGIYRDVKERLAASGALCVSLTTSFRAVPSLQRAVNAAFAPLMTGDAATLQAEYVPLSPIRPEMEARPALVALPVPEPYGYRGVTQGAIEGSLPGATGAFVGWLLDESGWKVTERERPGERVPVAARHICLLLRRFSSWGIDVTRPYVEALEARGIPHLLVGGKSFHVREEVETLRAALSALEWPDDELSVFAALHGSLFALGDEELFEYRHHHKRLHPFRIPGELPDRLAPVAEALSLLAALSRARNERPVAETIGALLAATRAHAGFMLRPAGEQALANVLHLAELARSYESSGGISFRGFVERLRDEAGTGEAPEAPILEEGSDGVRIMTVHKAKGLEFPVVILADITAKLTATRAGRWVDAAGGLAAVRIGGWTPAELLAHESEEIRRDEAEGVRIAYVAATRARDLLVVPAVGDSPFESGWVSPLNGAVYPERNLYAGALPAPGCPRFGTDSVCARPDDLAFDAESVRPGLHQRGSARDGTAYTVTWWDPNVLDLEAPPRSGLRQEELLGTEADWAVAQEDVQAYEAWRERRREAVEHGSRPSVVVRTATEVAAQPERSTVAAEVEVIELARNADRPAGPRFGTLVHAILATVPLDGGTAGAAAAARLQGRILGAAEAEVAAAEEAAAAVLAHPLLDRVRRAEACGQCRRETPVTLRSEAGELVEGVVDLAFLEDGAWIVVDFKTDRELKRALDVYRRQVSLYAAAVAAATGIPARALLLRV